MLIRDIERPVDPRLRGKSRAGAGGAMRRAAEGLGVVLGQLSETVAREPSPRGGRAEGGDDSLESDVSSAGRRARGFKFYAPAAEGAPEPGPAFELTEEQGEAFDMMKDARDLAADATAPPYLMPAHERAAAQEKLKGMFNELALKRIEALSSIFAGPANPADDPEGVFSLATPESARAAYGAIDEMILRFLNAGRGDGTQPEAGPADPAYAGHDAALGAAEQLKEFLISEGPAKAFARFREVNRSNVLGLLQ